MSRRRGAESGGLAFGEGSDDPAVVRSMLESAPDGLLVADPVGLIAYVNRRLEEISGYSRADLVGSPIEVLVPDASARLHRSLHDDYRRQPRTRLMGEGRADLALLRSDGTQVPVEIGLSAVRGSRGRTMTVASIRDVSEARAADRRRQRLLALLDLLPEVVFVFDNEFRVVYGNAAAARWYGSSAAELVGMTIWDFDDLLPVVSPDELDEVLRPGPDGPVGRRMSLRTKDGGTIPCEARVNVSEDPELGRRRIVLLHDLRPRLAHERTRARRAALSDLVADITSTVLAGAEPDRVYDLVVTGARRILDADNGAVLVPGPSGLPVIRAISGDITNRVPRSALPILRDVAGFLSEHPIGAVLDGPPAAAHPKVRATIGPMAVVPLGDGDAATGVLAIARWTGRAPFGDDDLDLLRLVGHQTTLAMELGATRVDRERLDLLEDRQRIARELHDGVVQDVIGVGMGLSRLGTRLTGEPAAELAELVGQLERTVQRLRHAVFDLQPHSAGLPPSLALTELVAEASRALGFEPELLMEGALDALPHRVVDDLVGAAREALSNVARHAGAARTVLQVRVSEDDLRLVVEDDGAGLPARLGIGSGLRNIVERAERLGGTATVRRGTMGGTRVEWTVPISAAADPASPGPATAAPEG